jgi:hypothetical protein
LFGPSGAGTVVHPDPLLQLKQIIGFTPRVRGRNVAWAADGQQVLFTSRHIVVAMDTKTGRQRYLDGHTAPVCSLALSPHGLLATGQEGRFPLIRLWDYETLELPEVPLEYQQDPTGHDAILGGLGDAAGAGAGAGVIDAMSGMLSPYAVNAAGKYAQLIRAQQARYQHLHPLAPYGAALQAAAQTLSAVSHTGAPSAAAAAAFRALPATGDAVCLTTVACDLASLHSVQFGPCFNRETQLMAAVGAVSFPFFICT